MEKITNHVERAKDRSIALFKDKPRYQNLLEVASERFQKIEDAIFDVMNSIGIHSSNYEILNRMASFADIKRRQGEGNEAFRLRIKRSASNLKNSGAFPVLYSSLMSVSGVEEVSFDDIYPKTVIAYIKLESLPLEEAEEINLEMQKVKSGGVSFSICIHDDNPILIPSNNDLSKGSTIPSINSYNITSTFPSVIK